MFDNRAQTSQLGRMDFLYPSMRGILSGTVHLALHPVDTLRPPTVIVSSLLLLVSGPVGASFAAILVCAEVTHRSLNARRVTHVVRQHHILANAAPYARQVAGYTFIACGLLLSAAGVVPFVSPICGLSLVVIGVVFVIDEHNRTRAARRLRASVATAQPLVTEAQQNVRRAHEEASQLSPVLQALGGQITEMNVLLLVPRADNDTEKQESARAAQLQDAHIKLARQHKALLEHMGAYETTAARLQDTLRQPLNDAMTPDALRERRVHLYGEAAVCETEAQGIAAANLRLTNECRILCENLESTLRVLKSEQTGAGAPQILAVAVSSEPGTAASATSDGGEQVQFVKKERHEVRALVQEMETMAQQVRAFSEKLPTIQENVQKSTILHTQAKNLFQRCCLQ